MAVKGFEGRDLARAAVFAAIIVVLGIAGAIPVGPVPITLQTLGVMLAGVVLGPKRAAIAVGIVLVLVAVGLPVLSGGRGGLGVFAGPSAGYLIGWLPGAVVAGLIAKSSAARISWWRTALGALVGGIGVVYALGIPVQAAILGMPLHEAAVGSLIFIPGDLVKVVLATVLALALHRAYPRAFESGAAAKPAAQHA
ncbi:BioY family transporter [Microbacterium sp. MEC084]|uniref:biotin transporter BioY n=1 Tax=unclassified Microbacterium TaxID=2609290 RepID=UPI0006FDC205|nr:MULTISPECIES: biotin transporter BioY [unclassified Microbacterium]KQZ04850.1 biotin biosynthesis protein BioC [Microbacterium sp. Root53]MCD1267460.1 BioY family transporter [Microbacterium sp. MEC084]